MEQNIELPTNKYDANLCSLKSMLLYLLSCASGVFPHGYWTRLPLRRGPAGLGHYDNNLPFSLQILYCIFLLMNLYYFCKCFPFPKNPSPLNNQATFSFLSGGGGKNHKSQRRRRRRTWHGGEVGGVGGWAPMPAHLGLCRESWVPSEGDRTLNALKLQSSNNETSARGGWGWGGGDALFFSVGGGSRLSWKPLVGQGSSSLPLSTEHSCKDTACVRGALCWCAFPGSFLNISYHQQGWVHLLHPLPSLEGQWGPGRGRRGA